jgi:DNA-directed RNA polymerase subunit RPC12/RpoP
MTVIPHEFICADCKAHVFSFGGGPDDTRCASCESIRLIKLRTPLTLEKEQELRRILGCEMVEDSDDA